MNTLHFISAVIDLKQLIVAIAVLIQISDFYILFLQIAITPPVTVSSLSPDCVGSVTKGEVSLYAKLLDPIGGDDSKSRLWLSCLLCMCRLAMSLVHNCRERWGLLAFKGNHTNAIILTMQCYEKSCNSISYYIYIYHSQFRSKFGCTYVHTYSYLQSLTQGREQCSGQSNSVNFREMAIARAQQRTNLHEF